MKRLAPTLTACAALILPLAASAQSSDRSVDEEIARAVQAAPERFRADATVITFAEDGSSVVLREGTNGLLCWDSSGEPGQQGRFSAQCTSEENRARVEQNHRIVNAAADPDEARAMFEAAERDGTREVAAFGTVYFHLIGDDPETGRLHTTVAVPHATGESLGLPEERRSDALWLMDGGTSGAHLMIPGM